MSGIQKLRYDILKVHYFLEKDFNNTGNVIGDAHLEYLPETTLLMHYFSLFVLSAVLLLDLVPVKIEAWRHALTRKRKRTACLVCKATRARQENGSAKQSSVTRTPTQSTGRFSRTTAR